ncbi:MAG: hypothetical protein IJZ36_04925 [Bacilli bacterium]|nr:hypothetical protein [Bacilli bacterium]
MHIVLLAVAKLVLCIILVKIDPIEFVFEMIMLIINKIIKEENKMKKIKNKTGKGFCYVGCL